MKFLGDLSFELDAMGAVLSHGFHPLKARQRRSIPNLQTVHRQGRIPRRVSSRVSTFAAVRWPASFSKIDNSKVKKPGGKSAGHLG